MEIKKELILRKLGDEYIIVPIGKTIDEYNGLFNLSECGAFIFEKISAGLEREQIIPLLLETYDIDKTTAEKDYDTFISTLREFGIV